jgi:hypothetical protein
MFLSFVERVKLETPRMKTFRLSLIALLFGLVGIVSTNAFAQPHWVQVAKFPGNGSCSFFFNANEGFIGTGNYLSGGNANIFSTTDGGKTWLQANFPIPVLDGEVTDLYFRDRQHGWATIKEANDQGWSGIYRTTDGGLFWRLQYQATFPVSIRETGRGVFFTERYEGVKLSTNGGVSFRQISPANGGILGIDFLNDQTGYVSAECAALSPHLRTGDGGNSWTQNAPGQEAWTVFADVASGQFFYASERDNSGGKGSGAIMRSTDGGITFVSSWSGKSDWLSGGISGSLGCRSVVYAQGGKDTTADAPKGLLRTLDRGASWAAVGGPNNNNDTRFSVTGRGAVVYAFDGAGGIYKTVDGGDGTLSPSILKLTQINQLGASVISSPVCDSANVFVSLSLNACDSATLMSATFVDDTIGELFLRGGVGAKSYFAQSLKDSLRLSYHPLRIGTRTFAIHLRLRQKDGYTEDTTVTVLLQGLTPSKKLQLTTQTAPGIIDFGTENNCTGDSLREVTVTNMSCTPIKLTTLRTSGGAFTVLSSFRPITLDAGNSRSYLVRFKPSTLGAQAGALYFISNLSSDSVSLVGNGVAGSRGLKLVQATISSSPCDSAEVAIGFRNTSCSDLTLDSVSVAPPFVFLDAAGGKTLSPDSSAVIRVRFHPSTTDTIRQQVTVHAHLGVQSFDTTLTITGIGKPGAPNLALTPSPVDFGSVSTCSSKEFTITATNIGCGDVDVTAIGVDDMTKGFSLTQGLLGTIAQNASRAIKIKFQPIGSFSTTTTLRIQTSAGEKTVVLSGQGVSDSGRIELTANITSVALCTQAPFSVTLSNTTCDTLFYDSAAISGTGSSDYSLDANLPQIITSGGAVSLTGIFQPQGFGTRTAIFTLHLRRHDGTKYDTTITLSQTGIVPTALRVALHDTAMVGPVSSLFELPIYLLDACTLGASTVSFSLHLRTDLLTPTGMDLAGTECAGATVTTFNVEKNDSVFVQLTLPAIQVLKAGILGWVKLRSFVTDTFFTNIALLHAAIENSRVTASCLSTSVLANAATTYTLTPGCGDNLISHSMLATGLVDLLRVSPNPTTSHIWLEFAVNPHYQNDGSIEVFDALGNALEHKNLIFTHSGEVEKIELDLRGASGPRYLRIVTPDKVSTTRILIRK